MGGGKCQLCMKESATIRERMWRGQSRVIRHRAGIEGEGWWRKSGRGVVIPRPPQEAQGTGDKLCVRLLKKSQVT